MAADDGGEPGGANRRLLRSAVERWVKPRAASVKRLVVSCVAGAGGACCPCCDVGAQRRRRCPLHSALRACVHAWMPRLSPGPLVRTCPCSFSARDQTHSFPTSGHGLRRAFQLLAPSLQVGARAGWLLWRCNATPLQQP